MRYPIGNWPILDRESKEVLIDSHGRRSYTTSMSFGPSLGLNIAMGYLPADKAKEGDIVLIEYFGEHYEAEVMDIHIDLDGAKTRITLSIGVAILDMSSAKSANNVEPLETIKQLIEQADEQMFVSKRNGRDQIHSQLIDQQLLKQGVGAA